MYFVFVMVTLIGITMHENIRKAEAKYLGYDSEFSRGWGQLFFVNEKMQTEWLPIKEANIDAIRSKSNFKDKNKWDVLINKDRKDHAYIELSGLIFTFSISLTGLTLLYWRRKKELPFGLSDWVGVFLSLFIFKEFITSSIWLISGYMLCEHAKFSQHFKLPTWGTEWIILIYSVLFTIFVFFKYVPRKSIIPFIIAGIPGGLTGIILWVLFIGDIAFPKP